MLDHPKDAHGQLVTIFFPSVDPRLQVSCCLSDAALGNTDPPRKGAERVLPFQGGRACPVYGRTKNRLVLKWQDEGTLDNEKTVLF